MSLSREFLESACLRYETEHNNGVRCDIVRRLIGGAVAAVQRGVEQEGEYQGVQFAGLKRSHDWQADQSDQPDQLKKMYTQSVPVGVPTKQSKPIKPINPIKPTHVEPNSIDDLKAVQLKFMLKQLDFRYEMFHTLGFLDESSHVRKPWSQMPMDTKVWKAVMQDYYQTIFEMPELNINPEELIRVMNETHEVIDGYPLIAKDQPFSYLQQVEAKLFLSLLKHQDPTFGE